MRPGDYYQNRLKELGAPYDLSFVGKLWETHRLIEYLIDYIDGLQRKEGEA
jgi:hypothetical protein